MRGGHNSKGTGTVEGTRSLDVMKLARAGYFKGAILGGWQWSYHDGTAASIGMIGGRDAVILKYRAKSNREDWQPVHQRVPILWTPCRFGGERPWFICSVYLNGVYCGRQVAKIYGGWQIVRMPSLLPARLSGAAWRPNGSGTPPPRAPSSETGRRLRRARRDSAAASEVDAAAHI
jgi:hypothetical protein